MAGSYRAFPVARSVAESVEVNGERDNNEMRRRMLELRGEAHPNLAGMLDVYSLCHCIQRIGKICARDPMHEDRTDAQSFGTFF